MIRSCEAVEDSDKHATAIHTIVHQRKEDLSVEDGYGGDVRGSPPPEKKLKEDS